MNYIKNLVKVFQYASAAFVVLVVVTVTYVIMTAPDSPKVVDTEFTKQTRQMVTLKNIIKETAKDPSSIQFKNEDYENTCVYVNGKNSFGSYTGFKLICKEDI